VIWCVYLALAALGYTYFGYPVLLGLLARLRRRRISPAREAEARGAPVPRISVLLPAFNAALFLPKKLESLLDQDYPSDHVEILIYCDGCTDDTEAVARRIAATEAAGGRIIVLADQRRLGKPTGLNVLSARATGELLLLNDVRQPLSATAISRLAAGLKDPKVGCTTGRLRLVGAAGSGVYWRYEEWIRRQESQFRGMVGMTGPIALVRRADFVPLPPDVVIDDVWLPMQQVLRGKRVMLVPEAEAHDAALGDDHEFRRKVRTLAGNYQLFARMPRLLIPFVNPIWFETFSHKIMRLVAPWMLLVLAVASVTGALTEAGPGAFQMRGLALIQLAFYGAAALGGAGGRLAGVARTFVVLNVAAVVGLWRFATGKQRVTWSTGRETPARSDVLDANVKGDGHHERDLQPRDEQ